nr:hypothetical protein BaRGS_026183 [Batillaria attramentaria]
MFQKCDGMMQPEYKKFSIDPQITSFEMLQGILAKAFDIKADFTLSYLARDAEGQEVYLSMLSDWDMDAAFQCAADPCLKLKVDLKPFDQELDDWDVIAPTEIPQHRITSLLDRNSLLGAITSNISSQVGKTMSSMQRAMGLKQSDETYKPLKPPMSDMEFHNYLDSAGFMVKPNEFRLSIYQGGIEGSLRRVAWRHLLNIFPAQMSGRERFDYLKRKEQEYYALRDEWKEKFASGSTTEEVKYVASMVKKDVLRTDRSHRLYAGGDDNKNILSLFHILVTYALTHPDVSYCQGMSDLASPLLVIQKDEAQAYICFCSLMQRLRSNFSPDGSAMMTQFRHLAELLQVHDPEFYEYLQSINAHDLFFCYRWLLLQLKREFPFEDALYMLEVMWSTLPPAPPEHDLALVDADYNVKLLSSSPCSPSFSFQHSVYAKLLAMRCSNRMRDFAVSGPSKPGLATLAPAHPKLRRQGASFDTSPGDEDRGLDYPEIDNPMTRSLQRRSNSIDQVLQDGASAAADAPQENGIPQENGEGDGKKESKDSASVRSEVQNVDGVSDSKMVRDDSQSQNSSSDSVNNLNCQQNDKTAERQGKPCIYPVPDCTVTVSDDVEGSAETNSSYANISVELGTADSEEDRIDDNSCHLDTDRQMQFNMSLESEPGTAGSAEQEKKDGEDEGYSGFFSSMKKLLSSPKRRPADIVIPNDISSSRNSSFSGTSSREQAMGEASLRRGHSDSGVSDGLVDGEASGSWSSSQPSQTTAAKPPSRPHPLPVVLPPPQDFGNGNPFLMFLCLTLLLQHRNQIIQAHMDYEDTAMLFDKMVRRHNVQKVLHQARELYSDYLRSQQTIAEQPANEKYGCSV